MVGKPAGALGKVDPVFRRPQHFDKGGHLPEAGADPIFFETGFLEQVEQTAHLESGQWSRESLPVGRIPGGNPTEDG